MAATIDCSGTTCTFVVQLQPYVATPDDYAALSTIFGLVLAAASIIWAAKRVYVLLTSRPEA